MVGGRAPLHGRPVVTLGEHLEVLCLSASGMVADFGAMTLRPSYLQCMRCGRRHVAGGQEEAASSVRAVVCFAAGRARRVVGGQ